MSPTQFFPKADRQTRFVLQFVFPNPQHTPAHVSQSFHNQSVSFLIFKNLVLPIGFIGFWLSQMSWATVPETSVHENNKIIFEKYEIGASEQ